MRFKTQIVKFLFIILFICTPILSKADFCFKPFEKDTAIAKAIFVGKVVKIEKGQFWQYASPKTIFTFNVIESFKGLEKWVGYISLIGPIGGCCNEHFVLDSTFLVFAYGDGNSDYSRVLWTNDCSSTGIMGNDIVQKHYKQLGSPLKHTPFPDEKLYKSPNELRIDTLLTNLSQFKNRINTIEKDKNNLNTYLYILGIVILALCILTIKLRVRNKKKQ